MGSSAKTYRDPQGIQSTPLWYQPHSTACRKDSLLLTQNKALQQSRWNSNMPKVHCEPMIKTCSHVIIINLNILLKVPHLQNIKCKPAAIQFSFQPINGKRWSLVVSTRGQQNTRNQFPSGHGILIHTQSVFSSLLLLCWYPKTIPWTLLTSWAHLISLRRKGSAKDRPSSAATGARAAFLLPHYLLVIWFSIPAPLAPPKSLTHRMLPVPGVTYCCSRS